MDKLTKFLRANPGKKDIILNIAEKIRAGNFSGLDIIRMEGRTNEYRCRIGKIRIVFFYDGKQINILKVGHRGDVYK